MDAFVQTLTNAFAAPEPPVRRGAEEEMREFQRRDPNGFCQHCLHVITTAGGGSSASDDLAFFATVALHVFVEAFWRAKNTALASEQRNAHRNALFGLLAAPTVTLSKRLVLRLVAVAAKMAREDFPKLCPSLFTDLVAALGQAQNDEVQLRLLLALHHVLKEQNTRRTGARSDFVRAARFVDETCRAQLLAIAAASPCPAGSFEEMRAATATKVLLRLWGHAFFDVSALATVASAVRGMLVNSGAVAGGAAGAAAAAAGAASFTPHIVDRVFKILAVALEKFPTELGGVDPAFLSGDVLPLLADIIRHRPTQVSSTRALTAMSGLLEKCQSCAAVGVAVQSFFTAETVRGLLSELLQFYFVDTEDDGVWDSEPEKCVLSTERESDDDSPYQCAEQLFLQLLATGGSSVAREVWAAVFALLDSGRTDAITSALHAMGIGYSVLSEGEQAPYLDFLISRLLPALAAAGATPRMMLRRVIWVIGMWCEVVPDPGVRLNVHEHLLPLLQSSDPVIQMTVLRAQQNFAADSARFSVDELPPKYVATVFAAMSTLLPRLETPGMISEIANHMYLLVETLPSHFAGDRGIVVRTLLPALERLVGRLRGGGADDDGEAQQVTVGALVDSLASAVSKLDDGTDACLALLPAIHYLISEENPIHVDAEEHAWDLFLAVARSAPTMPADALGLLLHHTERGFSALPVVFHTAAAVLLSFIANGVFGQMPSAAELVGRLAEACKTVLLTEDANEDLVSPALSVVDVLLSTPPTASLCVTALFDACVQCLVQMDPDTDPRGWAVAYCVARMMQTPGFESSTAERLGATGLSDLALQCCVVLDNGSRTFADSTVAHALDSFGQRGLPLSAAASEAAKAAVASTVERLHERLHESEGGDNDDSDGFDDVVVGGSKTTPLKAYLELIGASGAWDDSRPRASHFVVRLTAMLGVWGQQFPFGL